MATGSNIDGILVQWGERLFYPANRIVKSDPLPRLHATLGRRAAVIRQRIAATVIRRAPQVFIRTTGGGKGVTAISEHFRYISKTGRLAFEDDRGVTREGREALRDLMDQWRYGGAHIANVEPRREARNVVLSMPAGADAGLLQEAVRQFARIELAGHRYVMVLHEHQASPHVHLCVRVESTGGTRLRTVPQDLHRWRETFAERLRSLGIEAEATGRAARGELRNSDPMWRVKAKERGGLRVATQATKTSRSFQRECAEAATCWAQIAKTLQESERADDRALARHVADFLARTPFIAEILRKDPRALSEVRRYLVANPPQPQPQAMTRDRPGPERTR